jgi:hypothetical protein
VRRSRTLRGRIASGEALLQHGRPRSVSHCAPIHALCRADHRRYADQGSNTILPPSPPLSMQACTSLAIASGSRSITTG